MSFTAGNCNGTLELSIFWLAFISGLALIFLAIAVYTNEENSESQSWASIFLFWLWPLRIFVTSNGLNPKGKKFRPYYILSFLVCFTSAALMFIGGFCAR